MFINICFLLASVLPGSTTLTTTKNNEPGFIFQTTSTFGYIDKRDSIEFVFGQQKMIKIGTVEFLLDKRRGEIKEVFLAGDFNEWKASNSLFRLKTLDNKLYKIVISKTSIGKKGEVRQFKFVLNGEYWVEPPAEATNKITGADGNTNLFLKL